MSVSLKSGDSVAFAVSQLKKNAVTQADVIGHLKSNPVPLDDLKVLEGVIPFGDLLSIVAAQRDMEAVKDAYKLTIKVWRTDTKYTRNGADSKPKAPELGKGNIGVYGLQRMPVTLYPNQWEALLDRADEIRKLITDNRSALSTGKAA